MRHFFKTLAPLSFAVLLTALPAAAQSQSQGSNAPSNAGPSSGNLAAPNTKVGSSASPLTVDGNALFITRSSSTPRKATMPGRFAFSRRAMMRQRSEESFAMPADGDRDGDARAEQSPAKQRGGQLGNAALVQRAFGAALAVTHFDLGLEQSIERILKLSVRLGGIGLPRLAGANFQIADIAETGKFIGQHDAVSPLAKNGFMKVQTCNN